MASVLSQGSFQTCKAGNVSNLRKPHKTFLLGFCALGEPVEPACLPEEVSAISARWGFFPEGAAQGPLGVA